MELESLLLSANLCDSLRAAWRATSALLDPLDEVSILFLFHGLGGHLAPSGMTGVGGLWSDDPEELTSLTSIAEAVVSLGVGLATGLRSLPPSEGEGFLILMSDIV